MRGRFAGSLILCTLLAATLPPYANAQTSGLSWESCSATNTNKAFACDTNAGTFELVMWLIPFPFDESHPVSAANAGLTVVAADAVLPSWWQVAAGGCRANALSLEFSPTVPTGCTDAWGGLASGSITYWTNTYCGPNAIQLDLFASMPPGQTRTLTYARYPFFRIKVAKAGTTGAGSCGGCSSRVCFSGDGIGLDTPQGHWSFSTFDAASWQGGTCGYHGRCSPVGTGSRSSTWGGVKSLYR